jgi:hypothetical protein
MKTENQNAITKILITSVADLTKLHFQIREDLLEVIRALSLVTGKSQVEYLQELNKSVTFRIRLMKGIRKRKVGRPRKEKVITNGSK